MIKILVPSRRQWFSGKMNGSHSFAPGSIPGWRTSFCDSISFISKNELFKKLHLKCFKTVKGPLTIRFHLSFIVRQAIEWTVFEGIFCAISCWVVMKTAFCISFV